MLKIGRLGVGADGVQSCWGNDAAVRWERVRQRRENGGGGEPDADGKVGRVKVLRGVDDEHAGVIEHAITGAENGIGVERISKAQTRREVVAIGRHDTAADAVLANLREPSGGRVKCGHAVKTVNRRHEVFVAQAEVQRKSRRYFPIVLQPHSGEVTFKRLGVVELGLDGGLREAEQ